MIGNYKTLYKEKLRLNGYILLIIPLNNTKLDTSGMFPRTEKFALTMEKLFLDSQNIKNPGIDLSGFFNNSSMARILDVFLDNPDTPIYTVDLLGVSDLSRKSLWVNMPKLLKLGILIEEQYKTHKFYRLNKKNDQVKQISKFREILTRG